MTNANKQMNPPHFCSDPVDIQLSINPEILVQILDNDWLRSDVLEEVSYLSKC